MFSPFLYDLWWWVQTPSGLATTVLAVMTFLGLVELILHRYNKTLGSVVVVPCKHVIHFPAYVSTWTSWTKKRWSNLLWRMSRKQRMLFWEVQRDRIIIDLTTLVADAKKQKALFTDTTTETSSLGKALNQGLFGLSELNQRRIVVAMEARMGALEDAIAVVKDASVPNKSGIVWRQAENIGNPNYGKLERIDDNWPFDKDVWFVEGSRRSL